MERRKFLTIAGTTIVIAGVTYYLLSDKSNFVRADTKQKETTKITLQIISYTSNNDCSSSNG